MVQRYAICAIVKDEGKYLREWIAYHISIGFDTIVVYDNESSDETAWIVKQAEAIKRAKYHYFPSGSLKNPQISAYKHFHQNYKNDFDWVLFLDADEFLNLKRHSKVSDLLHDLEDCADAIGVNWRLFGDGGGSAFEEGNVIERFRLASHINFRPNRHIKSIVRMNCLAEPNVHSHRLTDGSRFVSPSGKQLKPFPAQLQDEIDTDVAQINHYFCKTEQEWTVKRMRGKASQSKDEPDRIRPDSDFRFHNKNDEVDETILSRISDLRRTCQSIFS